MADTFSITDPRAASVTTTAPTPAERSPGAPPNEAAAARLYPDTPKAESPDPGSLYSTAGLFRDQFNANLPKLGDAGVLTFDEQEAERTWFPAMIVKSGLTPAAGLRLHELYTQRRLEHESDDSAMQRVKDEEQTHRDLRQEYTLSGIEFEGRNGLKARVERWFTAHPDARAVFQVVGPDLELLREVYDLVRRTGFGVVPQ